MEKTKKIEQVCNIIIDRCMDLGWVTESGSTYYFVSRYKDKTKEFAIRAAETNGVKSEIIIKILGL